MSTLGQQVYEAVEQLKTSGMKGADAFKKVAQDRGKSLSATRGNYYSFARKQGDGTSTRGRGRATVSDTSGLSVDSAVRQARDLLARALSQVDAEVDRARAARDRAESDYQNVLARVEDRKQDLQRKIDGLG